MPALHDMQQEMSSITEMRRIQDAIGDQEITKHKRNGMNFARSTSLKRQPANKPCKMRSSDSLRIRSVASPDEPDQDAPYRHV